MYSHWVLFCRMSLKSQKQTLYKFGVFCFYSWKTSEISEIICNWLHRGSYSLWKYDSFFRMLVGNGFASQFYTCTLLASFDIQFWQVETLNPRKQEESFSFKWSLEYTFLPGLCTYYSSDAIQMRNCWLTNISLDTKQSSFFKDAYLYSIKNLGDIFSLCFIQPTGRVFLELQKQI